MWGSRACGFPGPGPGEASSPSRSRQAELSIRSCQSASLIALREQNTQLQHQQVATERELKTLQQQHKQLAAAHEALQRDHASLGALHEHLPGEHEALTDRYSHQKTLLRRTLELQSKVLSDRCVPAAGGWLAGSPRLLSPIQSGPSCFLWSP